MDGIGYVPPEVKSDERQLLLFWALHEPITVAQMARRGLLGDAGLKEETYERAFRRVRADFEENGVYLREYPLGDVTAYRVDDEATYMGVTVPTQDELMRTVMLLGSYLDRPDYGERGPYLDCLRRARDKLAAAGLVTARLTGAPTQSDDRSVHAFEAMFRAYVDRLGVTFDYTGADGAKAKRDVDVYGVFRHGERTFYVGFDRARDGIRVFRDDRVDPASVKVGKRRFEVPTDFSAADYTGLPFEYGPESGVATFEGDRGAAAHLTRNRGTWIDRDTWQAPLRNLQAGAAWSVEALCEGLVPTGPAALLDTLREGLKTVALMHGEGAEADDGGR